MTEEFRRALSAKRVEVAKPKERPYKLADGGGLHLLVQPSGAKLWRYKFRVHGVEGQHAIGVYPSVTLAHARERHNQARALVTAGQNPNHVRKQSKLEAHQSKQRRTLGAFSAVVESWRALSDSDLRPGSIRQRERELSKDLLPTLKDRQVDSITRLELSALLEKVKKRAPETARNLRTHLSAIFEHAINKGLVMANPTPPRSLMGKRKQTSHPAMPVEKIGKFLRAIDDSKLAPGTRVAMLLVLLCASRKEEIIGAKWDEIDLDKAEWIFPAARMKGKRDHLVPLSQQAVALLRGLRAIVHPEREFLFPNRRTPSQPMANRSLNAVLERLGFNDDATVHGFRSVFSTRYNELGVNPDVIERCLTHVHGNSVRAAYNRAQYLDQRRLLLQEWADWLDEQRGYGIMTPLGFGQQKTSFTKKGEGRPQIK
ncbi:MAG: tyrosine-type recombinase/integrase [Burkholderiales bacterium]|nr:tyrosine-type recombinase/integrase [Burkholderiales bacterium]